jgi:hypothetical protein
MTTTKRTYEMLGNESLWEVATICKELFQKAGIDHSICGGVAVCLHGYQRNTTDLDLIIDPADSLRVKELLQTAGFVWNEELKEFCSPGGIVVQFLMAGEKAGRDSEVPVPQPNGELNVEEVEGLPVVRLSRLIEMKLASGMGNLRRTHKDFADVVELIAIRKLDGRFASLLHRSLRPSFRELLKRVQGES